MIDIFENIRLSFKQKDFDSIKANIASLLKQPAISDSFPYEMIFHPLGFIYSKLHEFPDKETIRLHIWDKKRWYQEPLMDIHNHFYTVNSIILAGKIKNILYELKSEMPPTHAVYKGSYNATGDRSLVKTEQSVAVLTWKEEEILKDQLYQITPSELHSSYVDTSDFTCTLVYTEAPGNPTPLVLGPLNGEYEYKYPTKFVDKETIDYLINKVLAHLE